MTSNHSYEVFDTDGNQICAGPLDGTMSSGFRRSDVVLKSVYAALGMPPEMNAGNIFHSSLLPITEESVYDRVEHVIVYTMRQRADRVWEKDPATAVSVVICSRDDYRDWYGEVDRGLSPFANLS